MEIKQCMLTNNITYKAQRPINLKGIVVHSTGVNQRYLARWVQPSDDDPNKDTIIADLGKNYNNNSWNKDTVSTIVHCMIGYNKADEVEVYQTMPFDICCGGVYHGVNGSFNDSHIQFEMLEDNHKDEAYFREVVGNGIKLCAYLCKEFGLPVSSIVSHYECGRMGYGSMHGDPENWLKDFGYTMDDFRKAVEEEMGAVTVFKKGDIVGIKPGVTKNINNRELAKWVYDGRDLWVYSSDERQTKITIDKTLNQVTAAMHTSDLYLKESVSEPESVTVSKEEYDKLVADKIALQTAYDNLCNSYDELSNDYDTVRQERDALRETALDLRGKIEKIREIAQ